MTPLLAALGSTVVTLSPAVATIFVGTLIPLAVGLATKSKASSAVKEAVNAAAAVAVAVIAAASTAGGIEVSKLIVLAVTTFGATKAAYLLWRALGVTDIVQGLAPGVGIGGTVDSVGGTAGAQSPPALGGAVAEHNQLSDNEKGALAACLGGLDGATQPDLTGLDDPRYLRKF